MPRPGVTPAQIVQALDQAALDAGNAAGHSTISYAAVSNYHSWANNAETLLQSCVALEDVSRILGSERHARIMSDTRESAPLVAAVISELQRQSRHLSALSDTIQNEVRTWTRSNYYVIADTNVHIHNEALFTDWDVRGMADVRPMERLSLVIPLLVVDELDRLKGNDRKIANKSTSVGIRASNVLRLVNETFTGSSGLHGTESPLRAAGDRRGQEVATLWMDTLDHRRLSHADSELVAVCQRIDWLAGGRRVTLVTYDSGCDLRARDEGIRSVLRERPISL